MGLLDFLSRPWRQTTGKEPVGSSFAFMRKPRASSAWVDRMAVLSTSTANACAMAIAESIASSECKVTLHEPDGGRRELPQTHIYGLLNDCANPEQTADEFWIGLIVNALLGKGGYAEIAMTRRRQEPGALYLLDPERVNRDTDSRGRLVFDVHNPGNSNTVLPRERMFEVRRLSVDGQNALPMIEMAVDVFGRLIDTQDFGASFFANGAMFGGLWMPKDAGSKFKDEQVARFQEQLSERHQGPQQAHGDLFVPVPLDYQRLGVDPNAAQFIETEQHMVEEICRWFRVPPSMVQHHLRSTFSNIEHQGIQFVRDAIIPWCERLRREIHMKLIRRRDIRVRWDIDWLREGDAQSVAAADRSNVFTGIDTIDEVRTRRGQATRGGTSARPVIQTSMTFLDDLAAAHEGTGGATATLSTNVEQS